MKKENSNLSGALLGSSISRNEMKKIMGGLASYALYLCQGELICAPANGSGRNGLCDSLCTYEGNCGGVNGSCAL